MQKRSMNPTMNPTLIHTGGHGPHNILKLALPQKEAGFMPQVRADQSWQLGDDMVDSRRCSFYSLFSLKKKEESFTPDEP